MKRVLFRALLRTVDRTAQLYPNLTSFSVRAPVSGELGTFNPNAAVAAANLVDSLEQVVPGLEAPPSNEVVSWDDLKQLIRCLCWCDNPEQLLRANFAANKAISQESDIQHLIDQAFAALRAVPEQAYLESCSSTTGAEGVLIEATSCYSDRDPAAFIGQLGSQQQQQQQQPLKSFFKYRVRIINLRQHPIKVLGRRWIIRNDDGTLEGKVDLSPHNGVVGQQPYILPDCCFQYYSGAHLSHTTGQQQVPTGSMEGELLVDLYGPDSATPPERVRVPVGPFKLGPPPSERSRGPAAS